MKVNPSPLMTAHLVEREVFRDDPFSLVDVGVSGGIEPHWRVFGISLQAVGFDPLIEEIARLNSIEANPSVRYIASLVGCHRPTPPSSDDFNNEYYSRSSTVRAWELLQFDYAKTYFDQTHQGTVSANLVELDQIFVEHPERVDFVKVDTDGHDLEVLLGAEKLLSSLGPLGLAVETLLVGVSSPNSNLYSNVDAHLRRFGYSVFAIDPRFHSRAALPKPFRWYQPADTHEGQARWADTLFLRDVCLPGYEERFDLTLTPHKLLKLCCIFEMHGFEDCAAEVLLHFRDRLEPVVDLEHCLDLLTPALPNGRRVSYREYISFFETNVAAFYSGS